VDVAVAATADVEVRPSARNPRTAVAKAYLTVFEYFIGVTPGGTNSESGLILSTINDFSQ
jgi:hypothetical protein